MDPGSSTPEESLKSSTDPPDPTIAGAPPVNPPVNPPPPTANAANTPGQPTVFCQKGKCYPYDPAKMKNPNMNLEAKPGMILTAPAPAPTQKNKKRRYSEDEDDEKDKSKSNPSAKNKGGTLYI